MHTCKHCDIPIELVAVPAIGVVWRHRDPLLTLPYFFCQLTRAEPKEI